MKIPAISFSRNNYLTMVCLFALVFVIACGNEKPAAPKTVTASNPYSSESVFDEVKKKIEKDPNDVDALYHLGELYERNSQYKEAAETYDKVLKLKPEMGYVHFKAGTAYDRINQPDKAVVEFRKAVKYLPKYPVLYNNMGVAYGKLGKFDEEISALKNAVRLRSTYASARYNLGVTYLKKKDKKNAMKEYEALKEFDAGAADSLMKAIKEAS